MCLRSKCRVKRRVAKKQRQTRPMRQAKEANLLLTDDSVRASRELLVPDDDVRSNNGHLDEICSTKT